MQALDCPPDIPGRFCTSTLFAPPMLSPCAAAWELATTNRLDLNVLVDYCWPRFLDQAAASSSRDARNCRAERVS